MALVRQTLPTVGMGRTRLKKHLGVATWAGVVAALFGVMAFLFLVWRDHGHANIMVNEQSAPALAASQNPATGAASSAKPGAAQSQNASKDSEAAGYSASKQEFTVSKTSTQQIRSIRLKLTKTDPAQKIYDMRVIAGKRWSTHRHLKVNEPLWIALDREGSAINVVVTSVGDESVTGYWTESKRSAHVTSRVRPKRH